MLSKQKIEEVYARLMIANEGLNRSDEQQNDQALTAIVAMTQNSANPTLAQLTLLSQFEHMMYVRIPSTSLTQLPILPSLNTPVLPMHLHRLATKIFDDLHRDWMFTVSLLAMIFERGYTVPPTVWLPYKGMVTDFNPPNEVNIEKQLPGEYLLWFDRAKTDEMQMQPHSLSLENWDEWHPTQRVFLLKEMRETDPSAARDLLIKFAETETAEKRLSLIETLTINLSGDDKSFLQSLDKDRSQKIRNLAKVYLARLGEYDDDDSLVDELFDELEVGAQGIRFKTTKNNKRHNDRYDNLDKVSLFALARKFNLSLAELLLAWDFNGNENISGIDGGNYAFFSRIVNMISDDELHQIAKQVLRMIMNRDEHHYYPLIRARLPLPIRQEFAHENFLKGESFSYLLGITPNYLDISFGALQASMSYQKLIDGIEEWHHERSVYLNNHDLILQIHALGLLISQDTAKACLAHLEQLGVMRTDPALSILHLNALLDKHE